MICPYCGNDVDDGSKLCPYCGAEISETEVKPGADTSSPESPQSSKKSGGDRSGLAVGIIYIVAGVLLLSDGIGSISFDWTYIGYATAILMLASGILGMTKVSVTDTSVVEIVISAILLVLGFMCINYIWGDIAFFVSISFIIRAIVNIVSERKQKE